MVYNSKRNLLYVHIPKTGGSTIEYIIDDNTLTQKEKLLGYDKNNCALQHYDIVKLKSHFDNNFENLNIFTIVRNPYDRIVSDFHFLKDILKYKTFDDYIDAAKKIISNNKYDENPFYDHFKKQSDFIFLNNKQIVTEIYRFEDFENNLTHICEKYGFVKNDKLWIHKGNYEKTNKYEIIFNYLDTINDIYYDDFINLDYKIISKPDDFLLS
jgi:hypothetical protein